MRYFMIMAVALAGCALGGGTLDKPAASNPITGDAISVTTLDGGPVTKGAAPVAASPEALPEKTATDPAKAMAAAPVAGKVDTAKPESAEVAEPPPEPLAPEVLACMKQGGEWSVAGDGGAMACIHRTQDSGKICHKKSDCQGDCLAISGSCSPITPLFGCNDILQNDGSRVTQCID